LSDCFGEIVRERANYTDFTPSVEDFGGRGPPRKISSPFRRGELSGNKKLPHTFQ